MSLEAFNRVKAWADHTNNPVLQAYLAQYGDDKVFSAQELNDLRDALKYIETIIPGQVDTTQFLSSNIANYPNANLPISDTTPLLVNQGGVWKKLNKSDLLPKTQREILFGGTFEFTLTNTYYRYPNSTGTLNWSNNNYDSTVANVLMPDQNSPILHYFNKNSKILKLKGTCRPLAKANFTLCLVKYNLTELSNPFTNPEIILENIIITNTKLNTTMIVDISLNIDIEANKVICVYLKSSVATQLNRIRFTLDYED